MYDQINTGSQMSPCDDLLMMNQRENQNVTETKIRKPIKCYEFQGRLE